MLECCWKWQFLKFLKFEFQDDQGINIRAVRERGGLKFVVSHWQGSSLVQQLVATTQVLITETQNGFNKQHAKTQFSSLFFLLCRNELSRNCSKCTISQQNRIEFLKGTEHSPVHCFISRDIINARRVALHRTSFFVRCFSLRSSFSLSRWLELLDSGSSLLRCFRSFSSAPSCRLCDLPSPSFSWWHQQRIVIFLTTNSTTINE